MGLSSLLATRKTMKDVAQLIEPQPINYKINRSFNTNYSNISNNLRRAKRLYLSGNSQQVNVISRFNAGNTQFGNFYLGQPLQLNYLGRHEGMPGGSGSPPTNKF
jgi:hypothetical protein